MIGVLLGLGIEVINEFIVKLYVLIDKWLILGLSLVLCHALNRSFLSLTSTVFYLILGYLRLCLLEAFFLDNRVYFKILVVKMMLLSCLGSLHLT